ncbi:MAG TPA: rhodanese-like domain-containing protein [Candidatus Paceibacterota bacterium]
MKKTIYITLGIIALVGALIAFSPTSAGGLLSSSDFITKYKSTPDAVLVDVRTPAEFDAGHIQGAINVDYENINFESYVKKLDVSKTYFVYCRSGNRSSKSIVIMKNNGIKSAYELQGGISNTPELLK